MKKIDVKPYIQNPKKANCSLNAMRVVCDYYFEVPPSRYKLKKLLKTCPKTGTYTSDIIETLQHLDFNFTITTKLTWQNIKREIKSDNLILISYQSGPKESHSSIISGYEEYKGIKYVYLCDSWIGETKIAFDILRVLINKETNNMSIMLRGIYE